MAEVRYIPRWHANASTRKLLTDSVNERTLQKRLLHNLKLNLLWAICFDILVTWVKFPMKCKHIAVFVLFLFYSILLCCTYYSGSTDICYYLPFPCMYFSFTSPVQNNFPFSLFSYNFSYLPPLISIHFCWSLIKVTLYFRNGKRSSVLSIIRDGRGGARIMEKRW